MRRLLRLVGICGFVSMIGLSCSPQGDQGSTHAGAIEVVARSLRSASNPLGVDASNLVGIDNPHGDGVIVYSPQTIFAGVERLVLWLVVDGQAFPLNGATQGSVTPDLPWLRDQSTELIRRTGPLTVSNAIAFAFGRGEPTAPPPFIEPPTLPPPDPGVESQRRAQGCEPQGAGDEQAFALRVCNIFEEEFGLTPELVHSIGAGGVDIFLLSDDGEVLRQDRARLDRTIRWITDWAKENYTAFNMVEVTILGGDDRLARGNRLGDQEPRITIY